MKKHTMFSLLLFVGMAFLALSTSTVTASVSESLQSTSFTIATAPGTKYNQKSIDLLKNTTYEITFLNEQAEEYHNLIIASTTRTYSDVKNDPTFKSGDLLIGPDPASITAEDAGATGKSWSANFTTPNEDVYIIFFCSFQGHFAEGMWGYFKVGEPAGNAPGAATPGFELIIGLGVALSLALYKSKRR